MKTILQLTAGLFLAGAGALSAQAPAHAPDSIRIHIVENKNNKLFAIDTVVAFAQHQQLMNWLASQGIELPPPPPPPGADSLQAVFILENGDSIAPPLPPLPPMPPGEGPGQTAGAKEVRVIRMAAPPDAPGAPLPPPPPGGMKNGPPPGQPPCVVMVQRDSSGKMITQHVVVLPPPPPGGKAPQPPVPGNPAARQAAPEEDGLNVYPNPTTGHITLSFGIRGKGKTDIRITDMNGKVVFEEQLGEAFSGRYSKEIDLGSGKGMYTIEVRQGGSVMVRKVMVQ